MSLQEKNRVSARVAKVKNRRTKDPERGLLLNMAITPDQRKLLEHHWRDAESMWKEGVRGLDHLVLLVSTGAFAISITYIGILKEKPDYICLLAFSWIALAVSMFSQVLGYLASINWGERVKQVCNDVSEGMPLGWELGNDEILQKLNKSLEIFLKVTVFSFIAGVTALLIFATINIF